MRVALRLLSTAAAGAVIAGSIYAGDQTFIAAGTAVPNQELTAASHSSAISQPAVATARSAVATTRGSVSPTSLTTSADATLPGSLAELQVQPSSIYTGTFLARAQSASAMLSATLTWYDATGNPITADTVSSAVAADQVDQSTRYTVAGLAPAAAVEVALGMNVSSAPDGEVPAVTGSMLVRRAQGSDTLAGPLSTHAGIILDRDGNRVQLRGFNRPGQWDTGQPGGLNQHDIAQMKAWGANVVRISLGEQMWLPDCGSNVTAYRAAIDQTVKWINDLGMLAVVTLHMSAPTCTSAGTNPMPDVRSLVFWQSVAQHYRDAPLVAFDLYNEPYGVTADVWRHGGPAIAINGLPYQAVGLETLLATVRSAGAPNLALLTGLAKGRVLPTGADLTGANVVWAIHDYNCDLPWACYSNDGTPLLSAFAGLTGRVPVFVSEFGYPSSRSIDGVMYNTSVINYAEAQGWSWAAWAWDIHGTCNAGEYFNLLSPGTCGTGTGTYEPTPTGIPILRALHANSSSG